MSVSPLAGKTPEPGMLVDVPRLITHYFTDRPDPEVPAQRVSFGTSGHRGSAFHTSFNEWHILATTQAICEYRRQQKIDGPLYLGMDTHALSMPAFASALEVLAANSVTTLIAKDDEYTPTPAISHAILTYNATRTTGLADGIVITPSHNPPGDGGFKYNPPHGGPAEGAITSAIEKRANELLAASIRGVNRVTFHNARRAPTTHQHDYVQAYVQDLENVVDLATIRDAKVRLGVDPLGGAGVRYWAAIAERYGIDLTILSEEVDPTFRFMTMDWDGQIRMDPSSQYAMRRLIGFKDRFDVAFACDTDHDRHGIVTKSAGLLPPNHYLAAAVYYLFENRPEWSRETAIGKTLVSSQIIDRVAKKLGRKVFEVPVGFKWFVDGLLDGSLAFGGEESAGASFARRGGGAWSTDKDGIIAALLSGEITARLGMDPGALYNKLTKELGEPVYTRVEAPASPEVKEKLKRLSPEEVTSAELAGEPIRSIETRAPANDAPIGGLRVVAENGWFAVRPSGTENLYKIYAESFRGDAHLHSIVEAAQAIVHSVVH